MKLNPLILGSVATFLIVGCNSNRRNDTGTTGGAQTETGSMQGAGTATDTSMSNHTGMRASDSTAAATGAGTSVTSDSAKHNQTESGMTNKKGHSTLGPGAKKTKPDQGQPVTSKGDTVLSGGDSVGGAPPR
jgi:hypothetical protein